LFPNINLTNSNRRTSDLTFTNSVCVKSNIPRRYYVSKNPYKYWNGVLPTSLSPLPKNSGLDLSSTSSLPHVECATVCKKTSTVRNHTTKPGIDSPLSTPISYVYVYALLETSVGLTVFHADKHKSALLAEVFPLFFPPAFPFDVLSLHLLHTQTQTQHLHASCGGSLFSSCFYSCTIAWAILSPTYASPFLMWFTSLLPFGTPYPSSS
jgi:hypothetical protein